MSRYLVASALVAALVACGGTSSPTPVAPLPPDEPQVKDGPAEPVEKEPVAEPEPPPEPITITVPAEPVTVKLLKAGKGKKAALGYKLTAGTKQAFTTKLAVTSTSVVPAADGKSGGSQSTVLPTMILGYAGEVVEVAADGAARIRVVLETVDFEEAVGQTVPTEALSEAFESLKGLIAEYTVSAQGVVGDQSVTFPAGTAPDASMTQQILPALVALPTEALGTGATWEVSRGRISNFDADVKTVYTLKARKGEAATVEGKTTIKGGAQQIDEGGMTIEVAKIEGSGKSALDLTTASLVAIGTLNQDVSLAMKVQDQAFETKSSTTMTTAAK